MLLQGYIKCIIYQDLFLLFPEPVFVLRVLFTAWFVGLALHLVILTAMDPSALLQSATTLPEPSVFLCLMKVFLCSPVPRASERMRLGIQSFQQLVVICCSINVRVIGGGLKSKGIEAVFLQKGTRPFLPF